MLARRTCTLVESHQGRIYCAVILCSRSGAVLWALVAAHGLLWQAGIGKDSKVSSAQSALALARFCAVHDERLEVVPSQKQASGVRLPWELESADPLSLAY